MDENRQDQPRGFAKARRKAEELLTDGSRTRKLLDQAMVKASKHKGAVKDFWEDLKTLQRLLSAYISGAYRQVGVQPLLYALAAVVYFVNPFDILPDFLAVFGFIDDASIIAFVMRSIKTELDQFREWELGQQAPDDHLGI